MGKVSSLRNEISFHLMENLSARDECVTRGFTCGCVQGLPAWCSLSELLLIVERQRGNNSS